jgi:hypothetical protein
MKTAPFLRAFAVECLFDRRNTGSRRRAHFGGMKEPLEARGLGFIVEKDGFVLTNYDNLVEKTSERLFERLEVTSGSGSLSRRKSSAWSPRSIWAS